MTSLLVFGLSHRTARVEQREPLPVRDELRRHPLVDEIASESADGATAARLG